jgi:hypothetical protein
MYRWPLNAHAARSALCCSNATGLRQAPCAESSERYRSKTVHRRLYSTAEIAGYHHWKHLRQVWLVEQDTLEDNGRHQKEQRFFLTNLHVGR